MQKTDGDESHTTHIRDGRPLRTSYRNGESKHNEETSSGMPCTLLAHMVSESHSLADQLGMQGRGLNPSLVSNTLWVPWRLSVRSR